MNIASLYTFFASSTGVTTDSRNCPKGSIFFALKGESFNGNAYAEMALAKGCSYAVVDEQDVVKDERFILVGDVLTSLQVLANHHRKILKTPIIGITGSNGKTTTKELLAAVLSTGFNLHFTQGNFNNHIGVPLTLLKLKEEHEMAIIEMGANHPGEIGELCEIVEPDMGIITNIGKAHLEGFGGIEGVKKTKKELYDYIRKNGGRLFVNGSDDLLLSMSEGIERTLYNTDSSIYDVTILGAIPALTLCVSRGGNGVQLQTQMVGEYNSINVATALSIGDALGLQLEPMKDALEAYAPSNNRSQIIDTNSNRIILDAYNANPASMGVAVSNFISLDVPNKVVMLGAMKELGEYSDVEHRELFDAVAQGAFDKMIFVGREFLHIKTSLVNAMFFETLEDAKNFLGDNSLVNSTVLIKGSRSMKMESLVELL